MEITRNTTETGRGSTEFTGDVYLDTITTPSEGWRVAATNVHFAPGARTSWHTHPHGQTIWVTEGVGLCQRRGGSVELIRPGDRVFFEPGEVHWHGATATRFMAHVAIQQAADDGSVVVWGEAVSDAEYAQAPSVVDA